MNKLASILMLAVAIGSMACDQPPTAPQTTAPPTTPQTTAQPTTPQPESTSRHLAAAHTELPNLTVQVAERHGLTAPALAVELAADLQLKATYQGKTCTRTVPDGQVPAELITNVDHTLDRCVRELLGQ